MRIAAPIMLSLLAGPVSADVFELWAPSINGAQAGTPSEARGVLSAQWDSEADTFSFTWEITGPLLGEPTVASIERGGFGQSGDPVFAFHDAGGGWATSGSAVWSDLTPGDDDDIAFGRLNVTFYTTEFADGEIRGHIYFFPTPSGLSVFGLAGLGLARRRRSSLGRVAAGRVRRSPATASPGSAAP